MTTGQQILLAPAIRTCHQKAVRNDRSQYKAGYRRNRAIRVWESFAYTSFSTEQTRELLKRWRKFTPQITSSTNNITWIKPSKKVEIYQLFTVLDFSEVMDYALYFEVFSVGRCPTFNRVLKYLSVRIAQDVLAGENLKTATKKHAKQALRLPSQNSSQSGAGRKGTKRKPQPRKNSSPPGKKRKTSETRRQIFLLEVKWHLFITNFKSARSQNSISLPFRLQKRLSPRANGLSTTPQ